MTDEDLQIISVYAPTMIRMLKSREDRIIAKIYGEFRNGKTEHLTALAEFACVRDQINEINSALRQYENQKGQTT